jgi:protein arginine kinase activator
MLCQICHKNYSTIHLVQIENDQKLELHICEECAKKQAISAGVSPSLHHALEQVIESKKIKKIPTKEIRCPVCNITFAKIKSKMRLGCPNDYKFFRDKLEPIIERIHGATKHVGKVPQKAEKSVKDMSELQKIQMELEKLQAQLKQAVDEERYEDASVIHKKITELEQKKQKLTTNK